MTTDNISISDMSTATNNTYHINKKQEIKNQELYNKIYNKRPNMIIQGVIVATLAHGIRLYPYNNIISHPFYGTGILYYIYCIM